MGIEDGKKLGNPEGMFHKEQKVPSPLAEAAEKKQNQEQNNEKKELKEETKHAEVLFDGDIMLSADTMCVGGKVKGITRYGVVSEKSSVLARASFETPLKHIFSAALVGEEDHLQSVVENVMLNQPVPVGTGLPGLQSKLHVSGKKK